MVTVNLAFSLCFILMVSRKITATDNSRITASQRLLQDFDVARSEVNSMRNTATDLNNYLVNRQKKACNSGVNSHHCALADYDQLLQNRERISSIYGPGKRSRGTNSQSSDIDTNPTTDEEVLQYIARLAQKRKDLDNIISLLDETDRAIKQHQYITKLAQRSKDLHNKISLIDKTDTGIKQKQKRTCAIELGGACRTEWASALADQYYYLMGPNSPGKRRRRSVKSLIKSRIIHKLKNILSSKH